MSDITGSTQLYETESNRDALAQVDQVLNRMRQIVETNAGHCVKSQGDDVLSFFDTSEAAFQAASQMINEEWPGDLSVHVGMYFGEILSHEDDIYGRAVNTAARLTSLAKPGEILLGDSCFDDLSDASKAKLLMIGELALRGKSTPTRVYACSMSGLSQQTVLFVKPEAERAGRTEHADFFFDGQKWTLGEGETLSIGRSAECDIVMQQAWVSRRHAALSLRRGQLELTDHSSMGSIVTREGGAEVSVHRRATLLSGDGTIFCGGGTDEDGASAVRFIAHALRIQAAPNANA